LVQKPNKLQPAIIGGIIIGLLWSIPFLNLANLCCCLGVMVGGAVAAKVLINRSPYLPVSSADGAVAGVLAGVIGAGIHLLVGIPLGLVFNEASVSLLRQISSRLNEPQIREMIEQQMRAVQDQPIAERLMGALFSWFVISVISVGFATLGGVIGVAIFEKRKGQPMPPSPGPGYPPPGFTPPDAPPGPPSAGPPPY
jgi:hypothetical protein